MAGYSGTPLSQKLGIKPDCELLVVGAPDSYLSLLEPIPTGVQFATRFLKSTDIVHLFTTSKKELEAALKKYRAKLKPKGTIWVSWPKKAAKVETDITEDVIREVALPLGFVDIKVCAVDEVWSALKLVVRKGL
jgi:hypothetical protein